MELSIRRWKPAQLLLGWGVYWAGLIGVKLGPAIRASWRATSLPEGHGNISASFDNTTLSYTVIEDGVKTITASAPMSTVLLWVVVPPLALWLVWLFVRERPNGREPSIGSGASKRDALPAGSSPAAGWRVNQDDRVRVEREGIRTPNP